MVSPIKIPQEIQMEIPLNLVQQSKVKAKKVGDILLHKYFDENMYWCATEVLELSRDIIVKEAGGAATSLPVDKGDLRDSYKKDEIHFNKKKKTAYLASHRAYARAIEGARGNPWGKKNKGKAVLKVVRRVIKKDRVKLSKSLETRIAQAMRKAEKRRRQ